ncbi:Bifunctional epoxide hydrolase 2 [Colletotrichum sp. SAR 10_70]|nr:Bifunctional epoxide hydrolase 2 [Colletotrichum sp. SAR 10_71]KAI8184870.1 Bifunctional epoxide hydrolase 2 [Colletotrichum sp. SAR 10_70]
MDAIPSKTIQISHEITYRYYISKSTQQNLPTVLFLHGFPSSAADFSPQLTHLITRGYDVLAPDLLGYGGTSKPDDPKEYVWRAMSAHIAAILDAEDLTTVVGVGHDLGSWFLSRLYHFYPSRFTGLVFMDVGYAPPGQKFDVELINRMTKEMTGEERFRYWDLFTDDEGVSLMNQNVKSVVSLMHASPDVMAANLGPKDKAREWVAAGRIAQSHIFGDEKSAYFKDKVAMFKEGGWTGPTNWYKALRENMSWDDEEDMEKRLEVPVLVVGCGRDEMTVAGMQDQMTRGFAVAGYRFEVLDTGHWVMLEDPEGTNRLLEEFIGSFLRNDAAAVNHYETLKVAHDASPAEIKKSFYALSKTHHPDHNPNDPSATRKFHAIAEAYSVLGTPAKRSAYDRSLPSSHHHHGARRGSYHSSSTGPAGGRPASGLSRRRTTFRGPPPSFYRSGGWGEHSAKRRAAHESNTASDATGAEPERPGMGFGQDPYAHKRSADVRHFDSRGHTQTQARQDSRRAHRIMGQEVTVGHQETSVGAFLSVAGMMFFAFFVPYMIFVGPRKDKKKA